MRSGTDEDEQTGGTDTSIRQRISGRATSAYSRLRKGYKGVVTTSGDSEVADTGSEDSQSATGSEPARTADERSDGRSGVSKLSHHIPNPLRQNLLVKLFIGLFTILLLSGATAGVFYADMDSQLETQVDTQVQETANLQSDIYRSWFAEKERDLAAAGEGLGVDDPDIQSNRLESDLRDTDDFVAFHLIDRQTGEVLASSAEEARGESFYDHLDETAVSAAGFVGKQQFTGMTGETVFAIGDPLGTLQGQLLIGELAATDGGPEIRQTAEGAQTVVVNEEGEPVIGEEPIETSLIDATATETTVAEHGDSIYATAALENELYMVTQNPAEEVFALRESILQSFLITLLVTFGILSAVIGVGGRSIRNSLGTLGSKAREMESGNLDVDLSTGRVDEIGDLYGSFDAMRIALRERITEAETALEEAETARDEAQTAREEAETARKRTQEINEQIEASATQYSDVMEEAADGDLTVRMEPNTENENMAAIARDFNEMIAAFEGIVNEVKSFATDVEAASEDVATSSQEGRSASEQVSESIEEISEGAVNQEESLRSVKAEMNNLSATIEEIAASSNEVAEVAATTAETGRNGREAAQEAIAGMESVREESQQAVGEIETLASQVEQVDELIASISDIADQTSILALNANIEAARAGGDGDGDGFAVVAQEVKTLSEDAKAAAAEIEEQLETIREQTRDSAKAVQQTSEGIEQHTDSIENAADALDAVAEHAEETNTGVQEISAATDEQASTTEGVVATVTEVAEIAEYTSAAAQQTTATAQEQSAAMAEVSGNASDLSEQAMQLSNALERFRTETAATSDPAVPQAQSAELDGGFEPLNQLEETGE